MSTVSGSRSFTARPNPFVENAGVPFPEDERYMRMAIEQAERALGHDDVPVGAVVVHAG